VKTSTVEQLLALNHQFYQTFALQFSATRLRLQPGVKYILGIIPKNAKILDLGCGNGELAQALENSHFLGQYVGCDVSAGLLSVAKARFIDQKDIPPEKYRFLQVDLASPGWENIIPDLQYSIALSFAVMHHLPGIDLRLRVLSTLRNIFNIQTEPQSIFIHSVWQFMNSPRLRDRIQPWNIIGVNDEDVDPGDFLLDWRHGGKGLRYVHLFSENELQELAYATGFTIQQTFFSDGEGGKLGLYQIWQPKRV